MTKKICFVSGTSPEFLGGISIFQMNFIRYCKKLDLDLHFTWIYPGKENRKYVFEGINCIEVKALTKPFLQEISFGVRAKKFLDTEYFDIINTHANWGYCLRNYKKKLNQKIVHTYHGVTYYFFKTHLLRFNFVKKMLVYPALYLAYYIEKQPLGKADKIICVSNRVKKEIGQLYNIKENLVVIRSGVDSSQFGNMNKTDSRKKLKINQNSIVGLYVGRGGYWRKGLDRTVKLGEEMYRLNSLFRLIVIGPDRDKIGKLIEKKFITYIERGSREILPYYYSASDIFFCFSRYEGGAPILTLAEAMASKCLIVCSRDSEQEIIIEGKNGILVDIFDKKDANKILTTLKSKRLMRKITNKSLKTIGSLSLDKWGRNYLKELL